MKRRQALFLLTVMTFLLAGVVIGSILANTLPPDRFELLYKGVADYVASLEDKNLIYSDVLLQSVLKYGKLALFIWLLGFVKPGAIASLALMAIKGIGLGFAAALFARLYGTDGIIYILRLCFLQNIILIPAYVWLCYNSMRFSAAGGLIKNIGEAGMFDYFLVLLIGMGCVILASVLEAIIL